MLARICSRKSALSLGGWLIMGPAVAVRVAVRQISLVDGSRFKSTKAPQPASALSAAFQADDVDLEAQDYDYMREIGKVMVYCQAFSLPADAPFNTGDEVSPDGAQDKRGCEVDGLGSNEGSASDTAQDMHGDGEAHSAGANRMFASKGSDCANGDGVVDGAGANGTCASDGAEGVDGDDNGGGNETSALPDSRSRSSDPPSHTGVQVEAAGDASVGGALDRRGDVAVEHRGDEGEGGTAKAGGDRGMRAALVGDQFDDSLVIINPKAKFGKSAIIKRPNPFHGELPKQMELLIPRSKRSW